MKSLDDLKHIRVSAHRKVAMREHHPGIRIHIGMSTCSIDAGARTVLNKMIELIVKQDLPNVTVIPDGHISTCEQEPVVIVLDGDKKTSYHNVDEAAAERIIKEHIQNGKVVTDHLAKKAKK